MTERLEDKGEWGTLLIRLPPELADYRKEIQRFVDAMIYKLRRNAHKGKWEGLNLEEAIKRTFGEVHELDDAVKRGSTSEVLMEAADVANQALIVANIGLEMKPTVGIESAISVFDPDERRPARATGDWKDVWPVPLTGSTQAKPWKAMKQHGWWYICRETHDPVTENSGTEMYCAPGDEYAKWFRHEQQAMQEVVKLNALDARQN